MNVPTSIASKIKYSSHHIRSLEETAWYLKKLREVKREVQKDIVIPAKNRVQKMNEFEHNAARHIKEDDKLHLCNFCKIMIPSVATYKKGRPECKFCKGPVDVPFNLLYDPTLVEEPPRPPSEQRKLSPSKFSRPFGRKVVGHKKPRRGLYNKAMRRANAIHYQGRETRKEINDEDFFWDSELCPLNPEWEHVHEQIKRFDHNGENPDYAQPDETKLESMSRPWECVVPFLFCEDPMRAAEETLITAHKRMKQIRTCIKLWDAYAEDKKQAQERKDVMH